MVCAQQMVVIIIRFQNRPERYKKNRAQIMGNKLDHTKHLDSTWTILCPK